MHNPNIWGGSLELADDGGKRISVDAHNYTDWDRAALLHQTHLQNGNLDEIHQSWLLAPAGEGGRGGGGTHGGRIKMMKKSSKYVDFGCCLVSRKTVKWVVIGLFVAFVVVALPTILATTLNRRTYRPPQPDNYTLALHKALNFFNAQKSGKLPKSNGVSWRGNSGLKDGRELTDVKGGLVGGYYDAGDNTKFHFPMSFAMTMLSWSFVEYPHKYRSVGEYEHVRDLIKWGTDYLLKTFNSSSSSGTQIDHIYSQVGGAQNYSAAEPNDFDCWMRPEDMNYKRPVQRTEAGPDLAGEMAAAFAAASIVFLDSPAYSKKLVRAAETAYRFARDPGRRAPYSRGNLYISPYYNSTGYYDEYMWGAAWLYLATGNTSYVELATHPSISRNARAAKMNPVTSVLSWDNKLPAAMLLLTRLRMFLNPGYPYETTLITYHNLTGLNMCSYLKQFEVFSYTKGGRIMLIHNHNHNNNNNNLHFVANTVFLANLFADYMNATGIPGWTCGDYFFPSSVLRDFATSQMDYILGNNPMHMSYVVGFGNRYPRHVHHRAASIPHNKVKYSCKAGYTWLNTNKPNPNTIHGALVGGPIGSTDKFKDNRKLRASAEPTIAGNAGLVAALVSLTTTTTTTGVNRNLIFSGVPPLYPQSPPPPPPWKPA